MATASSVSNAFRRWRAATLVCALALSIVACSQVGLSGSGTELTASGAGVTSPGIGTPTPDSPPVIAGTPATSVLAGQAYSFAPTASDASGGTLTFSITNKPDWASFDSGSGQLSGAPTTASVGTFANIQISVSDGQSSAALDAFAITVVAPLSISGSPPTSGIVGSGYAFEPTTSAPPGTALTFSVQNPPPWATFNATTGEFAGTPTQTGSFPNIVISASDGFQSAALTAFTITVSSPNPTNNPPTIFGQPGAAVAVGSLYSFTPQATDPSGKPLTFSVQNLPGWASFNTSTGALTGTPTSSQVGTYSGIVISVSDATLSASLAPFSIKVVATLGISGTPATQATSGKSYSFQPTTNAPAGTTLSFSIQNRPIWATFSGATGMLSGTPTASQTGTSSNIVISVSDGVQTAALPPFAIQVTAPLSISGVPPTQVVAGKSYAFQPSTNAPSGTALTFSIQNKPAWATFNASTGALTGTPTTAQVGTYANIGISVSNGTQSSALGAFNLTVTNPAGPTISGNPPTSVHVGSAYSFTPQTTDPSGKTLTFSIQNLPSWASFNSATGALAGTPTAASVGTYASIVISVSDATLSASLAPFSIKVVATLGISGTPATQATSGKSYSFQPTTNAPAGTTLSFSIQNRPIWATFSGATGMLSGTPTASQTGTSSNIVISVSDGVQTAALPPFAIQVTAPLSISGIPPTQVVAGKSYVFQPSTNAPSGTALTFSIQNKPAWATFNASTGALTGTPTTAQVGTYANIGISVSNGTQSSALGAFNLTVSNPAGPTISGTPPTSVNAGSAYSFTPQTTDPSGKTLTFSIQNLPSWASFNSATGALAGTPTAASVGTYANIVISVNDGTASASLPAFTITVNQVSNGTATLNWTAVTQNTNGTALTDLAGYRVHYGTSANSMSSVVTLANPSLNTYLVTNLSSGTWYFGVTAYASDGTESAMSNVGTKAIP